jgi:hypothetical protein
MEYYQNNVAAALELLAVSDPRRITIKPTPVNGFKPKQSMKSHNVPHFIYSSSATVYGEPSTIPIPETSALKPESCYGRTKVMCEQILMDLAKGKSYINEDHPKWKLRGI